MRIPNGVLESMRVGGFALAVVAAGCHAREEARATPEQSERATTVANGKTTPPEEIETPAKTVAPAPVEEKTPPKPGMADPAIAEVPAPLVKTELAKAPASAKPVVMPKPAMPTTVAPPVYVHHDPCPGCGMG